MSENGEIYTAGKKFYTPAGTDGMDKFHLCPTDLVKTRLMNQRNTKTYEDSLDCVMKVPSLTPPFKISFVRFTGMKAYVDFIEVLAYRFHFGTK